MFLGKGLSKPADDVDQQAKDNLSIVERQASKSVYYKDLASHGRSVKPFKSFGIDTDSCGKSILTCLIFRHFI